MAEASPQIKAIVYQAVAELDDQHGTALRQEIINVTGLDAHLVDGAIKSLIDDDMSVRRVRNGVFKTVKFFEEPAISFTPLDDGRFKLEVNDDVLTLTPRALRLIFGMFAGFAMMHGRMPIEPKDRGLTQANLPLFP